MNNKKKLYFVAVLFMVLTMSGCSVTETAQHFPDIIMAFTINDLWLPFSIWGKHSWWQIILSFLFVSPLVYFLSLFYNFWLTLGIGIAFRIYFFILEILILVFIGRVPESGSNYGASITAGFVLAMLGFLSYALISLKVIDFFLSI